MADGPEPSSERGRTFVARLGHALRDQNWTAVVIEIGIVVLGVVIGFQVSAWGDHREARAQERELLRGLRAEFTANLALLDEVAEEHQATIRIARRVLEWTGPEPADVPDAVMDTLLVDLISEIPAYHPAMGEMDAMLGAGRLGLVRDDTLRTLLASWPTALERLRAVEDEMRADVLDRFFPYLIERVPLVTADRQVGFLDLDRPSRFPQRYDALLADVAFENHTENRWVMARAILAESEPVHDLLQRMVQRIDSLHPRSP
ncbi:hypothetical protein WI460_15865 [Gemmatimonadota bacterium Y43]|uniref:hypothetical protein n=1 Tax=Gaopeijia maritima TaxID=3119007 RepID=UPI0032956AE2